jgi:hypothetical protein
VLALFAARKDAAFFMEYKIPKYAGHYRDLRWDLYRALDDDQLARMRLVHLMDPERKLDRFRDYYLDLKMDGYMCVEGIDHVGALLQDEGPILVSVNKGTPRSVMQELESLFRPFAFCAGGRYESAFHIVYIRGAEPPLPRGIEARMRPFSAYFLPVNRRLAFGAREAEPFMSLGWGRIEQGGRWTEGMLAELHFMLKRIGALNLEIDSRTFRTQHIIVLLNGRVLEWFETDGGRTLQTIRLPGPLVDLENRLIFFMPDARSPESLGISEDDRVLGMQVYSMRFIGGPDMEADPVSSAWANFQEVCIKDDGL